MRFIKASALIAISFILLSCSSSNNLEGVDLKDACQILAKQPSWKQDLKQTHKQWGVPPALVMAIIYKESDFTADAQNKSSSAYGYAQVINPTWQDYEKAIDHSADRSSFKDSVDFIGWYLARMKDKYGLTWQQSGDLYLTYMLGGVGYKRYTQAPQSQSKSTKAKVAAKVAAYTKNYQSQLKQCLEQ